MHRQTVSVLRKRVEVGRQKVPKPRLIMLGEKGGQQVRSSDTIHGAGKQAVTVY
jgi:hypothetical protein